MYYIKMEQEGGGPVSDKFITNVSSTVLKGHTLKFTYTTLKDEKSYPYNYKDKDNKYHFKDKYIMTLFKMFDEQKELKKSKITSNWIEMQIDTNEKLKKLDTVYIEVSNFGTKDKHISSILKKEDKDYVNLKDDEFISYLTKSGLNKDAVKLIIAIYVTDYNKS